jgi:Leucine-rich repeat (LRR) protein
LLLASVAWAAPGALADHHSFISLHTVLIGSRLLPSEVPFDPFARGKNTQLGWLFSWLSARTETARLLELVARRIDDEIDDELEPDALLLTPPIDAPQQLPPPATPRLLPSDEAILRAIFEEGGGSEWVDPEATSTWMSPVVPACEWKGVGCSAEGDDDGFARVEILKLLGFGVTALSDKVSGLDQMHALNLAGNALTKIPDSVGAMAALTDLALERNRLESVPVTLGRLAILDALDLTGNQLRAIPEELCRLEALQGLYLGGNALESLPDCIGRLTSLVQLTLAGNRLESIPTSIGQLSNLTALTLSHNRLRSVPNTIGGLVKLEALDLNNNQLESIPSSVAQMVSLQRIHIYSNPGITSPLPDLSGLTSLTELLMASTNQSSVPPLPLRSLVHVDVSNNRLAGGFSLGGPKLEILNVNGNPHLTSVVGDDRKQRLPALQSLDAANCDLSSLSFLSSSSKLTDLDISQNTRLDDQPFQMAGLGYWPALQSFRAEAVDVTLHISSVFKQLGEVPSLISLDLSGNRGIYGDLYFPFTMPPLFILRLSATNVTSIGEFVPSTLPNLRVLSLADTPYLETEVPVDQQQWRHLEQIDILGTNPALKIPNPVAYPGTTFTGDVKHKTFSQCPTHLVGGTESRYSILADPSTYNWSLCQCLESYYGEPWKGCLECPLPPAGETGVRVDCFSDPGVLTVAGGWLRFVGDAVEVVACPSDSPRNPCETGRLARSLRSVAEWEKHVSGRADANITSCLDGYEGRLCSRCMPGFFRSGRSCHRCGARGLSWLNPLVSLALLTALGVKSVAGGHRSRTGLIRTLTTHAQLVALLPDLSLRLSDWVGFFVKSSASGSGGLRMNGLECAGKGWDGFYGPFVEAALLPVIVVIGCAWIGGVSGFFAGGRGMAWGDRCKTAAMYLWSVLLFGSVQRLLAPLNCTSYGSTRGVSYLSSSLWIACQGPSYNGLLAVSVVFGLGFIFGTIGVVLYRLRPSTKGTSSISAFLRSPYRSESYFWEAAQLVRMMALAMTSALTELFSPAQPVIVSSILILSLLAHTWRKPYAQPVDNAIESVSLTLLLSSYMAGLIASNPRFPPSATNLISWLFFAVNALFLASLTAVILFRSARTGLQRAAGKEARGPGGEEELQGRERPLLINDVHGEGD